MKMKLMLSTTVIACVSALANTELNGQTVVDVFKNNYSDAPRLTVDDDPGKSNYALKNDGSPVDAQCRDITPFWWAGAMGLPKGLLATIYGSKYGWEAGTQINPADPYIGPKSYQNLVHCTFPATGWGNYSIRQDGFINSRNQDDVRNAGDNLLRTYAPYKEYTDQYPPSLTSPCYRASLSKNTQDPAWGVWYWCKANTKETQPIRPCGTTATPPTSDKAQVSNAAYCGAIKLDTPSIESYILYEDNVLPRKCNKRKKGSNATTIPSFDERIGLPYWYTDNKNCACPCGYTKVESLPLKIRDTKGNERQLDMCVQPQTLYSCIRDKSVPANSEWKVSS